MKNDWLSKPNAHSPVRSGQFGPGAENEASALRIAAFRCFAAHGRAGHAVDFRPGENYARAGMMAAADALQ
jgi:hypothetical protein